MADNGGGELLVRGPGTSAGRLQSDAVVPPSPLGQNRGDRRQQLPPTLPPSSWGDPTGHQPPPRPHEDEELELGFPGLRRCLRLWEDPHTGTVRGHVRLQPGGDSTGTFFSHHPGYRRVAERGAALHVLLQHRRRLRLARDFSRSLKTASDFTRRLLALPGEPGLAQLCRELRTHAGHWAELRRRLRGDPWLLLRGHEAVGTVRRALLLVALHAVTLAERHAEARLRGLARAAPTGTPSPALLSDLCQALGIYNQVLGEVVLELGMAGRLPAGITGCHGATGATTEHGHSFSVDRVLRILAAERGRRAAERLQPFLQPRDGDAGTGHVCWEDVTVPWPPERGATVRDTGPSGRAEPPGLAGELRALCREDEELVGIILGGLVGTSDSPWHRLRHGPGLGQPVLTGQLDPRELPAAGCRSARRPDESGVPVAEALHAQYRRLCWGVTSAALGQQLGLPHCGGTVTTFTTTTAAQELSRALAQAGVPRECEEELGGLCLRLLCQDVLWSWERDFPRALGWARCDPGPGLVPVTRTARYLLRLYPPLACALRCLRPLPGSPPGLRLRVLSCCRALAQAACSWLWGRAQRYLAAWVLPHFLLVTQGDLPLLKSETDELVLLLCGTFPEPGDTPAPRPPPAPPPPPAPLPHREHRLCQHIRAAAASIQLLSGEAPELFSAGCKRVSAQIFQQTMPLGKAWRVGHRADPPVCPSPYAVAAVQSVLGQVLQSLRFVPRDAQTPTLARATTAFLEAWLGHVLARRITFSLQGARQLRRDLELVRELVGSERCGLSPESRRSLLALGIFQEMDGAIACLMQQPGGAGVSPRPWHPLCRCCWDSAAHAQEPDTSSLDTLDPPVAPDSPWRFQNDVPESYLSPPHRQWLELRLRQPRRWRVPALPCLGNGTGT